MNCRTGETLDQVRERNRGPAGGQCNGFQHRHIELLNPCQHKGTEQDHANRLFNTSDPVVGDDVGDPRTSNRGVPFRREGTRDWLNVAIQTCAA
jgi:hypothetical protein